MARQVNQSYHQRAERNIPRCTLSSSVMRTGDEYLRSRSHLTFNYAMKPFPIRSLLLVAILLAPWLCQSAIVYLAVRIFPAPVHVDEWLFTGIGVGVLCGLAACILTWTSLWHWRWNVIITLLAGVLTFAFSVSLLMEFHPCEVPFHMDADPPPPRLVCS